MYITRLAVPVTEMRALADAWEKVRLAEGKIYGTGIGEAVRTLLARLEAAKEIPDPVEVAAPFIKSTREYRLATVQVADGVLPAGARVRLYEHETNEGLWYSARHAVSYQGFECVKGSDLFASPYEALTNWVSKNAE